MDASATNCREASANLLAGYRGELLQAESDVLDAHLEACPDCRGEGEEVSRLADLIGNLPEVAPAENSFSRLAARIEKDGTTDEEAPANRRRLLVISGVVATALVAAAASLLLLLSPPKTSTLTFDAGPLFIDDVTAASEEITEIGPDAVIAATGLARAAIRSIRDLELTLAEGTRLVHVLPGTFRLETGRVLVHVLPGAGRIVFETPAADMEVTGTIFTLAVDGKTADLTVIEGEVVVRTNGDPVRVVGGSRLQLAGDKAMKQTGAPAMPERADPWRARDWCSTPTASLETPPDRLVLTLTNHTVAPLTLIAFDPSTAAYSLEIRSIENLGENGPIPARIQDGMVIEGQRGSGEPPEITLDPGESHRLVIDLATLPLPPGTYEVSAVYKPYGDLPDSAWRGRLESPGVTLTVK